MTFIEHNHEPGKPRAIETVYKGYKFRSRLEARYGVFFEALGLDWTYEPEGFDLDGVRYLPDFKVKTPQGADIWYEIKPKGIKADEKFSRFKDQLLSSDDGRAELLFGDPVDLVCRAEICPRCGIFYTPRLENRDPRFDQRWPGYDRQGVQGLGNRVLRFGCFPCDSETPFGEVGPEEIGFLGVKVVPDKGLMEVALAPWDKLLNKKILPAAMRARQARFEHGEKP